MKIVHLAPFAPIRAGIYEAARDMAVADMMAGNEVGFIDSGVTVGGERQAPQVGARDERGDFKITTAHPDVAAEADVLVLHTGVPDIWVVKNQAPMVWVVHGRPLAAFRPEQSGTLVSYSLYAQVATWPRSKAMVHFWPEYRPYWNVLFPEHKHVALDFPPIDGARFSPMGPTQLIEPGHRGEWNGLICDSWREDVDIFEVTHGAIEAAKRVPGLKWHLFAMESKEGRLLPCWEYLVKTLRDLNALGMICGRMEGMDMVYRGMDFLLTPHRIVTRCIGEALSCGLPVVAARGCKVTDYLMEPFEPGSVASAVSQLVSDMKADRSNVVKRALEQAENFSLTAYSRAMTEVYGAALKAA